MDHKEDVKTRIEYVPKPHKEKVQMPKSHVVPRNESQYVVAKSGVNVRSGPGTHHNIQGTLAKGSIVHITGKVVSSSWYRVSLPSGREGYIHDEYLSSQRPKEPEKMYASGDACRAPTIPMDKWVYVTENTTFTQHGIYAKLKRGCIANIVGQMSGQRRYCVQLKDSRKVPISFDAVSNRKPILLEDVVGFAINAYFMNKLGEECTKSSLDNCAKNIIKYKGANQFKNMIFKQRC